MLHQFGNADAPGQAQPSLIQVMTVGEDWNEDTLTWNNAPLALENVSRIWVNPMTAPLVWPGVAWTWKVSYAVAQAYTAGPPLRLALYEADGIPHSYHSDPIQHCCYTNVIMPPILLCICYMAVLF